MLLLNCAPAYNMNLQLIKTSTTGQVIQSNFITALNGQSVALGLSKNLDWYLNSGWF